MNSAQVCFLLYCGLIMGTAAQSTEYTQSTDMYSDLENDSTNTTTINGNTGNTNESLFISTAPSETTTSETSKTSGTSHSPGTTKPRTTLTPPDKSQSTAGPTLQCMFDRTEGGIVLIVLGGLVVLCTVLLVSTVALSCHVCCLKRHHRSISSRPTRSNIDLVSGAGYWGTGQRTKERPGSDAEPSETSPMIAELKQTQEKPGTETKEDGLSKTAKETPKLKEEAATGKGTDGTTKNGEAGTPKASSPSQENAVSISKQPAEPSISTATEASTPAKASSDVVVVVG